jgi:hypothetical protein
MKKTIKLIEAMRSIAIIAFVVIIGFSFAACGGGGGGSGGGDGGSGSGGTFTLTDIPAEFNGKKASFYGNDKIWAYDEYVSKGSVSFQVNDSASSGIVGYKGSDTVTVTIQIYKNDDIFDYTMTTISVNFKNGSATVSYSSSYWSQT